MPDDFGRAVPRDDADAVLGSDDSARFTTAARALILGNALSASPALSGLESDIGALGFSAVPRYWGGWDQRQEAVARSDDVLRQFGVLEEVQAQEVGQVLPALRGEATPRREARLPLWRRLAAEPSVSDSIAWLRLLMTDEEPVAAVAAAVSLSYWRRRKEVEIPFPLAVAPALVDRYTAASDPVAAAVASAARPPEEFAVPRGRPRQIDGSIGLIVHGTGAWRGTWWDPGGDFHTYAKLTLCGGLYSGGMPFSWSGAYRGSHRRKAAERLAKWVMEASDGTVCCLYAHSYGGVIALMSNVYGVKIKQLVLLSVPYEAEPVEWRNIDRAMSLRIHRDLVLLAARRRQRFTENVEEHWLPQWFVSHSDSHDPDVWDAEDCKGMLKL